MVCPCIDCKDRHSTCHSECKRYIIWKHDHEIKRQRLIKIRIAEGDYYTAKSYAIKRTIRNRGNSRKTKY